MKTLVQYIKEFLFNQKESILEMAQINTEDSSNSYFPWNKFKLYIYSNEHEPPHFHIINKQYGWDIRVDAITGDLVGVKKYGNRRKQDKFVDIIRDAKSWLKEPSADPDYEGKNNADVVRLHWNANNPDKKYRK